MACKSWTETNNSKNKAAANFGENGFWSIPIFDNNSGEFANCLYAKIISAGKAIIFVNLKTNCQL